jgi:hypothetical protein
VAAFRLNPERIAELEADGWRAYYDRDWFKLMRLMVLLNQEQFHIPFPLSVVAAIHVARGSAAWAPADHDLDVVRSHFVRFYRMARRWSGLDIDPREAARLEVDYWVWHRELVGKPDKEPFIQSMTRLHSHLFNLPEARMRDSAEWRVKANNTVDLITSKESKEPEKDWARLEDELRHCYRSIQAELDGQPR